MSGSSQRAILTNSHSHTKRPLSPAGVRRLVISTSTTRNDSYSTSLASPLVEADRNGLEMHDVLFRIFLFVLYTLCYVVLLFIDDDESIF